MNDIDLQFKVFKNAIIEINNYQSFTVSISNKLFIYQKLLEDNNIINKKDEITDFDSSKMVNFLYKDYNKGHLDSLETTKFTPSDFDRIELELRNRQYQLLLLNAFEAFEKYLKCAESYISILPKKKRIQGFSPIRFIMKLHTMLPEISTIIDIRNKNNPNFLSEVNLLLTFSVVERLRHQITHTKGYASNKNLFVKECMERIGRYNNGEPDLEHVNYLNSFFGSKQYENLICLTEIRDKQNPSFHYDRLGSLIKELASYIIFVHGHVKLLIEKTSSAPALA